MRSAFRNLLNRSSAAEKFYIVKLFYGYRVFLCLSVYLPPAYVVRREGNVLTRVCLSVHRGVPISHNALQHFPEYHGAAGGVPISHNALQHFPECHGAAGGGGTLPGPARGGTLVGGYPSWEGGTLAGGYPGRGVPCQGGTHPGGTLPGGVAWLGGTLAGGARSGGGGYPVRTTEGVFTTRRAVCLLHSCRRTFLFLLKKETTKFYFCLKTFTSVP